MSSVADKYGLSWADEPPPLVRWRNWPLGDNLPAGMLLVAGLVAAGIGVHWVTGRVHLGLFAVAALAVALWRFFVPVMFELNTDGVNQWVLGRHRRVPWNEIRRYETGANGVLLLPHADPCPMDAFRGLYLPWGSRRDEVLAQVRYHLDPPGKS